MIVRKLRLQRGWSQEQLATLTGLNIRTIQRIERGQKPGLESQKSLAAVFEVDVSTFAGGDSEMQSDGSNRIEISEEERAALEYAKGLIGFYFHLVVFIGLMVFAAVAVGPDDPVFRWLLLGWGIGIGVHALNAYEVFRFFSAGLERRLVEKRLGRKL